MPKLIPAILTDDPLDLERKLRQVEEWTDEAHIDFMDGEFVETLSVPPESLTSLNPRIDLEAHLMVRHPEAFVHPFQGSRIKRLIFHAEAVDNRDFIIRLFAAEGFSVGLAINPETPLDVVAEHLAEIEVVHCLTVHPGRQGNPFQPGVLDKVRRLREQWSSGTIAVDGGINQETIRAVVNAGADRLVVGSSIWRTTDPRKTFFDIKRAVE
jgi:ribulose-phosphate 3-epimerase